MHIEIINEHRNTDSCWIWRIVAGNKKVIGESLCYYKSRRNAKKSADQVAKKLKVVVR